MIGCDCDPWKDVPRSVRFAGVGRTISREGGGGGGVLNGFFKKIFFALISCLTLDIGNA